MLVLFRKLMSTIFEVKQQCPLNGEQPPASVLNWSSPMCSEGHPTARTSIGLSEEVTRRCVMRGEHDTAVERPRGETLPLSDHSRGRNDARAEVHPKGTARVSRTSSGARRIHQQLHVVRAGRVEAETYR